MVKIMLPTADEITQTFEPYTKALGQVAHAWNYFQETLGRLFAVVIDLDDSVALPIWYSTTSDRAQREMLKAACRATLGNWEQKFPRFEADITWLLNKANAVAEQRNDAIHAPCGIAQNPDGIEIAPAYFGGNPRALRLKDKSILKEFALYEASAETLSKYSKGMFNALVSPSSTWPDRPLMPTLGQSKTRKG